MKKWIVLLGLALNVVFLTGLSFWVVENCKKVKKENTVCIPKSEFERKFLAKGYSVVGVMREGALCGYLVEDGKNLNVLWYRDGTVIMGTAFNDKKENLNLKLIKSLIPPDRLTITEVGKEERK